MSNGRILFSQVMDHVPWKSFSRIVKRYAGDLGVRTLDCADIFRIMSFAQLTWRESLRDVEICLKANKAKLYHMGLKQVPARSTLSDALNKRDWRIYQELALKLTKRARTLYINEVAINSVQETVYALDSTIVP